MFKRRKPEEFPVPAARGQAASPAQDPPGSRQEPKISSEPRSGDAVPPMTIPAPPARTQAAAASVSQPKDPIAMSRLPVQTPAPSPNPSMGQNRTAMTSSRMAPSSGDRRTLVVGRGISVTGTIQDAERLVVEGTVEASSLNAAELQIAPGGVLKGTVEVDDAEISGLMDGVLTVRGGLVLRSSGQITGEARCRRLQVEDGGQLTGKISMIVGDAPPSAPQETPPLVADQVA